MSDLTASADLATAPPTQAGSARASADAAAPRESETAPLFGDLAMAGRYVPAGPQGESIGGDFFDLYRLDASRLLVAVGDVAGHGAEAFARMTWLRASTRAFCLGAVSPSAVLSQLDALHTRYEPEDIASLWIGMYDQETGVLSYASAGHLPAVLAPLRAPAILLEEAAAPPLGTAVVAGHSVDHRLEWPRGAVLVGYSDGLVERPEKDLENQLAVLRRVVENECRRHADELVPAKLVDAVLATMVPDAPTARDDVCVFALRRQSRLSAAG